MPALGCLPAKGHLPPAIPIANAAPNPVVVLLTVLRRQAVVIDPELSHYTLQESRVEKDAEQLIHGAPLVRPWCQPTQPGRAPPCRKPYLRRTPD
ncbi:Hypothetical protein EPM1_4141 [Stenotrophomonas maltophilia EPM1]|nr:Hypothetical protein EPM1_4141 [Stenotrophomonas maltophilia EPM1]